MIRLLRWVAAVAFGWWAGTKIVHALIDVFGPTLGPWMFWVLVVTVVTVVRLGRWLEFSRPWVWWPIWGVPVAVTRMVLTWRATCRALQLSAPPDQSSQQAVVPTGGGSRRSRRRGGLLVTGEPLRLIAPRRVGLRVTRTSVVVRVRMHPGQTPGVWEAAGEAFAHQWRVYRVRAVSERPGFVTLTGLGFDPLRYVRPDKPVAPVDGGWPIGHLAIWKWRIAGWVYGRKIAHRNRDRFEEVVESTGQVPTEVGKEVVGGPDDGAIVKDERKVQETLSARLGPGAGSYAVVPGILSVRAGVREDGSQWDIDFSKRPHWLVTGATRSGKSTLTVRVITELSARPVTMVGIDAKNGMELSPFEPRLAGLATTRAEAAAVLEALGLELIERTWLCRDNGARNIWELPVEVRPQPIVTLVDEVAELFLYTDKDGKDEAARCVNGLVRIGQLGAALGLHLWVSGQRFGSDLGPGATMLRAQLAGRICHRVSDPETAAMTLAGLPPAALAEAQGIGADLPGVAVAGDDSGAWFVARSRVVAMDDAVWTARLFEGLATPMPSLLNAIMAARQAGGGW